MHVLLWTFITYAALKPPRVICGSQHQDQHEACLIHKRNMRTAAYSSLSAHVQSKPLNEHSVLREHSGSTLLGSGKGACAYCFVLGSKAVAQMTTSSRWLCKK